MPALEKAVPLSTRLGLSASAGCVASSCCHPLDVIRIQMQTGTGYKNPVDAAVHIFQRTGGIRNFYEGLSAAYLRQFTYTAFRMGTFSYLLDVVKGQSEGEVSLTTKLLVGAIAGITGSIIGNPAELSLVRMGNDSKLPMDQRRNYKSSIHACIEVVEKEGVTGLWRGVVNSSLRAAVVNAFQLGIYGPTKMKLVELHPSLFPCTSSISTMFMGANISAFFAIGASMPLDVVKSRLMAMNIVQGHQPEYKGMVDCFAKTFQKNGVLVFWRGFVPAFVKLAPYTVISFTALETFTKMSGKSSAF